MRLNSFHRTVFINAVMDDVPSVDYVTQAQKILQDFQVRHMPKEVQAVYKNPELRGWLEVHRYYSIGNSYLSHYGTAKLDEATRAKIQELDDLNAAQRRSRANLRTKLEGVLASVTTREALVKALPEFEKYAPTETDPLSRSVPALANVVSDFVKAGWPKDKPKPADKVPAKRGRKAASK